MVRPTLKKQIPNIQEAIKETAWNQIAEFGAAALSLRAIARELKITAPAIYNYFPDRDALVTALILDAFTSLADSQAEALTSLSQDDHAGRLRALGVAYRQWAMTYPERYQLIFGTPIAGYVARPKSRCQPQRVGWKSSSGCWNPPMRRAGCGRRIHCRCRPKWNPCCGVAVQPRDECPLEVLYLALIVWGQVHGLVSIEIGNQFPPFISDAGAVYRHELERIVRRFVA